MGRHTLLTSSVTYASARTEPKELELDSEAVLKSIEAQHGLLVERAKGIYSFSHLTFLEYFAAREIVANSALENLVEHITEKRRREVFLLTVGMMRKADDLVLLMEQKIDELLAGDEKLQQFLKWMNIEFEKISVSSQPTTVRIFFFVPFLALAFVPVPIDLNYALNFDLCLHSRYHVELDLSCALDFAHALSLQTALKLSLSRNLNLARSLGLALSRSIERVLTSFDETGDGKFRYSLQQVADPHLLEAIP